MLLTHADHLLCLQLHTVHASNPCCWSLAVPTAAHSSHHLSNTFKVFTRPTLVHSGYLDSKLLWNKFCLIHDAIFFIYPYLRSFDCVTFDGVSIELLVRGLSRSAAGGQHDLLLFCGLHCSVLHSTRQTLVLWYCVCVCVCVCVYRGTKLVYVKLGGCCVTQNLFQLCSSEHTDIQSADCCNTTLSPSFVFDLFNFSHLIFFFLSYGICFLSQSPLLLVCTFVQLVSPFKRSPSPAPHYFSWPTT